MNRTRKKYSVSGALDHSISPNDPSDASNLKKLSSNILNYIKLKGNKYHNLSNKTKESKFTTNGEEKDKKNKDNKNIENFHFLWNTKSKSHSHINKLSDDILIVNRKLIDRMGEVTSFFQRHQNLVNNQTDIIRFKSQKKIKAKQF